MDGKCLGPHDNARDTAYAAVLCFLDDVAVLLVAVVYGATVAAADEGEIYVFPFAPLGKMARVARPGEGPAEKAPCAHVLLY